MTDGYTNGDNVVYEWREGQSDLALVFGVPLEKRVEGQVVKPNGVLSVNYTQDNKGLLINCAVFSDQFGPAYLELEGNAAPQEVTISGLAHQGVGELESISHAVANTYNAGLQH